MVLVQTSKKQMSHIEQKFHAKRRDAFNRGLTFRFTLEEFVRWHLKTPEVCIYCGIDYATFKKFRSFALNYTGENKLVKRYKKVTGPESKGLTMERLDDSQGYTPLNVAKCCLYCQMLKNQAKDVDGVTDFKGVGG